MKFLSPVFAIALAGCSVVGIRSGTEEPSYKVMASIGQVQIRQYAPRLAASVTVQGDEISARSAGFRRLARFIFGANTADASISMTAPVAQSAGAAQAGPAKIAMTAPVAQAPGPAGSWTITFFMPAKYTLASLPKPTDPGIQIAQVPGETYAVYRYSGIPGAAPVAAAHARLLAQLKNSAWAPEAAPVDWFYDPPWTLPFARRNEAAVLVRPRA
jgi:hypothetical protein